MDRELNDDPGNIGVSAEAGGNGPISCSIAPMLSVRNGAGAVEFYKAAFSAIEVFRIEDPGGAVVSRLSVGGAEFWVADESPEHANFSPESLGGGSVRMILTVPDPDAVFAAACAAGAREIVRWRKRMGGVSAAWSIHSAIIGRSVIRFREPTGRRPLGGRYSPVSQTKGGLRVGGSRSPA